MIYCVMFDGEYNYVEADSYADAVALWRDAIRLEVAPDEFDDEPESVIYLSDRPLIRKQSEHAIMRAAQFALRIGALREALNEIVTFRAGEPARDAIFIAKNALAVDDDREKHQVPEAGNGRD